MLATVVAVPFIRFLLTQRYGFFYPEVYLALVLLLIPCALMAVLSKSAIVFNVVTTVLLLLVSTNAVHVSLFPNLRLRYILIGLTALMTIGMYCLRHRFYYVVLVFALSVLGTDAAQGVVEWASGPAIGGSVSRPPSLRHVVYLILDEQIGLAGFPKDIPECMEAGRALHGVLSDNHFDVYPNAFSNYRSSWDSIPSILNRSLLSRTGEYFRGQSFRPSVQRNRLFEHYTAKNYAINAYYSDYIGFSSPEYAITSHVYDSNSLAVLHRLNLSWRSRLHQMLTVFLQADTALWGAYVKLAPQRFHPDRLRIGPLAVADLWPDRLLADINDAQHNTLFFAHLLTPHYPYVYNAEGRIRDPQEWMSESPMETFEPSEYSNKYRRYAGQVVHLSRQLGSFLQRLREMGVYNSMTVIIHGDHGSRIRLLKGNERQKWEKLRVTTPDCPAVSRYDYASKPELRDLLNRFSTLLAVKRPQASDSKIIEEKASVSYFLQKIIDPFHENIDPGLNSVYLFNAQGFPQEIPLLELWQDIKKESTPE